MSHYSMNRVLDASYEDVLERIPAALKEEGFGVLTEIDVRKTLKEKLGADFRKYKILGACNPTYAHQALGVELDLGVLLPCNVVVWEQDDGKTMVSMMDPAEAMTLAHDKRVHEVAGEVRKKLERVLESL